MLKNINSAYQTFAADRSLTFVDRNVFSENV